MIDMQTMVRPLNYSTKKTLRVIKENCTPSLRMFLRAYKVSDLDTLMILVLKDNVGVTNTGDMRGGR